MAKFLVINRDKMSFMAVTDSFMKADKIAWNDHPDVATVVLPLEEAKYFSMFSRLETMMLFKNETGEAGSLFEVGTMWQRLYELASNIPFDERSLSDLTKAGEGLEVLPPPTTPTYHPQIYRASPDQQYAAKAVNPAEAKPKAPRDPSAKPSPKGATGRVWEVAERVHSEMGGGIITKEMRSKIIAACEETGIHPATAATQYSKWKATK